MNTCLHSLKILSFKIHASWCLRKQRLVYQITKEIGGRSMSTSTYPECEPRNLKNPNSKDDYNSHFIFMRVKYWVCSCQLPTWRTFPSIRAFNFPANTFILFPLTKIRIINYILIFYSLVPCWSLAFCLLWDLPNTTCPFDMFSLG